LRLFGFSNEYYAIDNQILYPHVFFNSDYRILGKLTLDYRKCFTLLKTQLNLVILPENETEFNIIIMKKFRRFLDEIERQVKKAIQKKLSITDFGKNVKQAFNLRNIGDFKKYWEINKQMFQNWLTMESSLIEGEKFKLVRLALERFRILTENLRQDWKEIDQDLCNEFYKCLKKNKKEKSISNKVDDRDLLILSGCLTFVCSYLPYGILYLVTNDGSLYETAKMVVDGKISFGGKKLRPTGFDVVKPLDILTQYNKMAKANKTKTSHHK
jgi:hypothetical protein